MSCCWCFAKHSREIKQDNLLNSSWKCSREFDVAGMACKGCIVFLLVECHQECMCEALPKHLLPFYILAPVILKFLFEGYGFFFLEEIKKKNKSLFLELWCEHDSILRPLVLSRKNVTSSSKQKGILRYWLCLLTRNKTSKIQAFDYWSDSFFMKIRKKKCNSL